MVGITGSAEQMTSQKRIMNALAGLLGKLSYNSISVQSICDAADVSRKTFARHFASKEDVAIAQIRADFMEPIRALLNIMSFKEVANSTRLLYKRNYDVFYEHRGYYLKVIDALGIMWFVQQHMDATLALGDAPYAGNKIGEDGAVGDGIEADFVRHFFSGVGALGIKWWVEHDFCISSEELANLVARWGYARLDG